MPSLPFALPAELPLWSWPLLALLFVASLLFVPWALVRLPADYFHHTRRHSTQWGSLHPLLRVLLRIGKNLLGLLLLVLGVAMLVLPGQGLLTILVGVLFLDFPGKFRCERWLVSRKPVLRAANWLRAKRQRSPLQLD